MLTTIFDSEILKENRIEKRELLLNLLSRNKDLFKFLRTKSEDPLNEPLKGIKSIPEIKFEQDFDDVFKKLRFTPNNNYEKQFFYSMLKYATHRNDNKDYIRETVYITENLSILKMFLPGGKKEICLRHLFPNLLLVDLKDAILLFSYYEIKNNHYCLNGKVMRIREDWYNTAIFILLPELPNAHKRYQDRKDISKFLRSIIFKFKKLLYGVNCIGIEHYFGNLKKDPIEIDKANKGYEKLTMGDYNYNLLEGFMDPDNLFLLFYHTEYIISLITGIFDNLALLTKNFYNLNLVEIRISLSKDSGRDFLKLIKSENNDLKMCIDKYRDFINLIYKFREKVVHHDGLNQSFRSVVPNWNSFIEIDKETHDFIKRCKICNDSASKYEYISNWGILEQQDKILLDPYFFSTNLFIETKNFVEEYIPLIKKI